MGQYRRYGSDVTRAAIAEAVLRPQPVSLGKSEVGDEIRAATKANQVVAWVPFRTDKAVEVEGRVIAYTDRACLVEFTQRGGITHQVWVWAGAVRRREGRRN